MQALGSQSTAANRQPRQASTGRTAHRLLPFIFLFAAACTMFFADLGHYPLFNPDESLYAEPAREMLETGEYITTLLNYVVRFTKPPLVIWAMAGCYKVFGVNEFAARFTGAACAAVLVAATYLFIEKYATRRAALLAGFSLVTAPLFVGTAREAITDMPLSLFIAGALMAFFHGFQQRLPRWRWLGYVLVGLAVMTKGPVGLVLPVAVLGAYHLLSGQLKAAWSYYKPLSGLAVVALIAVPWFVVEISVTHGAYFQEFLVRENFQRFTSVVDHKGAWWYHLAAVAGGFAPWTIYAPQALWQAASRALRQKEGALPLFCLLWFVLIVAFFSVSVSKLLPYTLPAFPALAALVAIYIDRAVAENRRIALAAPLFLLAAGLAAASWVVPVALLRLRELPPGLPELAQTGLFTLSAAAIAAAFAVMFRRPQSAVAFFAAAVFACFLGFGKAALDVLSSEWEGPVPALSQYASVSGQPIVVWHMRKPSIPFYAGRRVLVPPDVLSLQRQMSQLQRAYIIGKAADLPLLRSLPGCRVLVERGRFVLLVKRS